MEVKNIIDTISYYSLFITGQAMVMIRLFDPFYRFMIRQTFFEYFGIVNTEPKEGIKARQLTTFLTSSLNIELVYIILAGITRFSNEKVANKNSIDRRSSLI
jgi:hypothetical protein